jgi:HPt (histidine-containing phosphotransfer) domain-containing protein
MDDDREFMFEILDESLIELPRLVATLIETCQGNDAKAIRGYAHTIKGLAANVSASLLREISARIESAVKVNELAEVRELLPELEKTAELTMRTIQLRCQIFNAARE